MSQWPVLRRVLDFGRIGCRFAMSVIQRGRRRAEQARTQRNWKTYMSRRLRLATGIATAGIGAVALLGAQSAAAAITIEVTNTNDSGAGRFGRP